MAGPNDNTAAPDERGSSDDESVNGALNADDVPQLDSAEAPVELQDASAARRQGQEAQEEGSEMGSIDAGLVDALPRRLDSPVDSMLSGPDDTPSVQVCEAMAATLRLSLTFPRALFFPHLGAARYLPWPRAMEWEA